jgi:hypothetical protein
MRAAIVMSCLWAAAAWADAPSPTGLALIQARYAGTWAVEDAAYDTEVSRAGTRQYELTRDCALDGAVLDCKFMAQGVLQGEQRFTWDAAAGVYHVQMDIGGHPQPSLTLTVKDNTWTFLEETADRDGLPIKLRILRQYHSDTEVSSSAGYSRDGQHWTPMSRGTEIRKDAAKPGP